MQRIILTAVALAAVAAPAFAGEAAPGCMTRTDIAWAPAIARHFALIDTANRGCVTPAQITAYRAALKADRQGQAARLRAALRAAHG